MSRNSNTGLARRASRAYAQVRSRLAAGVYRSQLGPTRERDVRDYMPARYGPTQSA